MRPAVNNPKIISFAILVILLTGGAAHSTKITVGPEGVQIIRAFRKPSIIRGPEIPSKFTAVPIAKT